MPEIRSKDWLQAKREVFLSIIDDAKEEAKRCREEAKRWDKKADANQDVVKGIDGRIKDLEKEKEKEKEEAERMERDAFGRPEGRNERFRFRDGRFEDGWYRRQPFAFRRNYV